MKIALSKDAQISDLECDSYGSVAWFRSRVCTRISNSVISYFCQDVT